MFRLRLAAWQRVCHGLSLVRKGSPVGQGELSRFRSLCYSSVAGQRARGVGRDAHSILMIGTTLALSCSAVVRLDDSDPNPVAVEVRPFKSWNNDSSLGDALVGKSTETILAQLYAEYENLVGLENGANLPDDEEDAIDRSGGSSVYGEVTFRGVATLMEHLGGAHGKVFYDLGSGLGKMCMQVACDWGALRAVGVELAATRHSAAEAVRGQLGSHTELPSRLKDSVEFVCADIMTVDMGDANIVYIASLCFDDSFMCVLGQRLETLPQLEYIATIRPFPPNMHLTAFECVGTVGVDMTWQDGVPVYIYARI